MYQFQQVPARAAYIGAMRSGASRVTVVITAGATGRHGATVSAFSSVSVDPPTVLVCLHGASRIACAVAANREFAVNVLPQSCQEIADRFAGRHDGQIADRFEGIGCEGTAIEGATVFACRVSQTIVSGSHRIFIAHVLDVREGTRAPLAYLDGAYHRVVPQQAIEA